VRLRRAEEIETLSYRTLVELNAESRLAPERRVASIARRPERAQRLAEERAGWAERRQLQRVARVDRSDRLHPKAEERGARAPEPANPGWRSCTSCPNAAPPGPSSPRIGRYRRRGAATAVMIPDPRPVGGTMGSCHCIARLCPGRLRPACTGTGRCQPRTATVATDRRLACVGPHPYPGSVRWPAPAESRPLPARTTHRGRPLERLGSDDMGPTPDHDQDEHPSDQDQADLDTRSVELVAVVDQTTPPTTPSLRLRPGSRRFRLAGIPR
jgi:hypothetical protein